MPLCRGIYFHKITVLNHLLKLLTLAHFANAVDKLLLIAELIHSKEKNNCPPGSGSVTQDYGSADPEEIFTDPQPCLGL